MRISIPGFNRRYSEFHQFIGMYVCRNQLTLAMVMVIIVRKPACVRVLHKAVKLRTTYTNSLIKLHQTVKLHIQITQHFKIHIGLRTGSCKRFFCDVVMLITTI